MSARVGMFGHHPDPVIDFEVEVDALIGMDRDVRLGLADADEFINRTSRALRFRVGGDARAVAAKAALRSLVLPASQGMD